MLVEVAAQGVGIGLVGGLNRSRGVLEGGGGQQAEAKAPSSLGPGNEVLGELGRWAELLRIGRHRRFLLKV